MSDIKIVVDKEKCVGCGLCVKDCPGTTMQLKDGKAYARKGCIECGHCFAVCPTGAVDMAGYDKTGCDDMASLTEFDSDRLLKAMKSRRTIRQFKSTPVEQEKIDKILEAGRYTPTATNAQSVAYTVLGSKQAEIESEMLKFIRGSVKAASMVAPALKGESFEDDFFFKGAPLVVVVSGKGYINASLASSYMELLAESMGLGVLYSGYSVACMNLNPKVRSMLKLPRGHHAVTVMVMGYPDVTYHRLAPRKPLQAKTL